MIVYGYIVVEKKESKGKRTERTKGEEWMC
jgi:hypothetical protein